MPFGKTIPIFKVTFYPLRFCYLGAHLYIIIRCASDDKLERFLKQFPPFPNAILVGGPADLFVIELTDQVLTCIVAPKFYCQVFLSKQIFR